jgi:hypothetical protein
MADADRDSVSKAITAMYHPICDWMNGISGPLEIFNISASAGTGGTISPSGAVTVNYGSSQAFTITPNTGYQIADVLVDGGSKGAVSSYTFTNVTGNHTIAASFKQSTFQIVASAGAGGTISPSGAVTVNYGANQTFNITPNGGYEIANVLVDGSNAGKVNSYTFTNVTADHTIAASFVPSATPTFQIVASAGAGGSINPTGTVTVSSGSNQTFTITPDSGYDIADVLADGSSVGAVSSYAFTNVTTDHTIAASFAATTPPPNPCGSGSGAGVLVLGLSLGFVSLLGSEIKKRKKHTRN